MVWKIFVIKTNGEEIEEVLEGSVIEAFAKALICANGQENIYELSIHEVFYDK